MKKIINIITILAVLVVSAETCFADVSIPVVYKADGKIPKKTRVIYELYEKDGQNSLNGETLKLDMTKKKKSAFRIPINKLGAYEYKVKKRTVRGGISKVDPKVYTVKVAIMNGETVCTISNGKGKEYEISYEDTFREKPKKTVTRRREQTGDKIPRYIIIGIFAGIVMFAAYKVSKWRSADSLDL